MVEQSSFSGHSPNSDYSPYNHDIRRLFSDGLNLERLRGSRILVVGATGLIGSCIVDVLMQNPDKCYQVIASGRNRNRAKQKFAAYWEDDCFSFIEMDVTQTVQENLEGQTNEKACSYLLERVDYIIDAASNASPNFFKLKPVEVMKANINGVSHLMEYGLEHGMRRMVYVSSGEIYGEGDGSEFTEMSSGYVDCASVRACYPSSKRAAETLCMSYVEEYHADVVIARLSHTYGPGFTESDNRVFAQFIRNVLRGEDIVLKSKGEAFRSWLYVVDAAHAILRLLMDGEKGNAYNVAHSESNISIRQLAELIAGKAHRKVVFDIPEDALQGNTTPITKATFNTDKLKALGWKPLFDVEQGFEHTLAECSAGSHSSSKQ